MDFPSTKAPQIKLCFPELEQMLSEAGMICVDEHVAANVLDNLLDLTDNPVPQGLGDKLGCMPYLLSQL